jgi:hypothetical protein
MTKEYPASLKEVKVDCGAILYPILHEYEEGAFDAEQPYGVRIDWESLDDMLDELTGYDIEDYWFSKFAGGSCYWGIMSAYPWEQICDFGGPSEAALWGTLLRYHLDFNRNSHVIKFKHNDGSPIGKWLRRHTSDGDVPINVETLFAAAVNTVIRQDEARSRRTDDSRLFDWIELAFCKKCDIWVEPAGRWCDCPECGECMIEDED